MYRAVGIVLVVQCRQSQSLVSHIRRLAHRQKVTWTESWDFLNCSCDLSEEEGKKALEQYLTRVPSPALSGVRLEQYDDFGSVMSPLILDIHCQEDSVKSLDANMSASDLDDKEGSTIDKALAECMDSKLSLHPSAFFTPKASKRGFVSRDQVFLTGYDTFTLPHHLTCLVVINNCHFAV